MNDFCSHASSARRNQCLHHLTHTGTAPIGAPINLSCLRPLNPDPRPHLEHHARSWRRLDINHDHAVAAALGGRGMEPTNPDEHVATHTADSRRWARCRTPRGPDPGRGHPKNGLAWLLPPVGSPARLTRHATIRHTDRAHPKSECPRIRLVSSQPDSGRQQARTPSSGAQSANSGTQQCGSSQLRV